MYICSFIRKRFHMVKTTDYTNTFIEVAEDSPVTVAEIPPREKEPQTAASVQYELLSNHPYEYTSDEVLFHVHVVKNAIKESDHKTERDRFFSKGQPCFRSSPLTKRYGWGIHYDAQGKMALYAVESAEYKRLSKDSTLKTIRAMQLHR